MTNESRDVTHGDVNALRDHLQMPFQQFQTLLASPGVTYQDPDRAREPLRGAKDGRRRPLCLMVRFLDRHPEYNPWPQLPSAEEMYTLIKPMFEDIYGLTLSWGRFAMLFGRTNWCGENSWKKKKRIPLAQAHLFWMLKEAVERDGRKALIRFVETVLIEAKVAGFGSLEELFGNRSWDKKADAKPGKKK